jgi:hypothetical protein
MVSCSSSSRKLLRLLLHGTATLSANTTAKQQLKCDKKQQKNDKKLQVHQQENDCIYSIFCSTMHQNHASSHVWIHNFMFKPGKSFYGKEQMKQLHVPPQDRKAKPTCLSHWQGC